MLGVLFSAALIAALVAKPAILGVVLSVLMIEAS